MCVKNFVLLDGEKAEDFINFNVEGTSFMPEGDIPELRNFLNQG